MWKLQIWTMGPTVFLDLKEKCCFWKKIKKGWSTYVDPDNEKVGEFDELIDDDEEFEKEDDEKPKDKPIWGYPQSLNNLK